MSKRIKPLKYGDATWEGVGPTIEKAVEIAVYEANNEARIYGFERKTRTFDIFFQAISSPDGKLQFKAIIR